jgi:drug/metabolite transporter (DMT)-like permease
MNHEFLKKLSLFDKTGIVGAILTALGWGMAGVFIKLLPNFSAFSIVAVRLALALVFIIPILLLQNNFFTQIRELRRLKVWLLSLMMLACYTFGTIAFQIAPVGEVTLLMTTAPIFTILFKFWRREKIRKTEYWGVSIAFFGICYIIFPSLNLDSVISKQHIFGNFLALLVSILLAIYAIWFRSLSQYDFAPNSISIALGTFIIGSLIFLPTTLKLFSTDTGLIDIRYLMASLGLGLVSTVIPTLCYAIAAQRLPPITTTSILLLEPILAVAFAFLILGTVPSIWIIPGTVFVGIGILCMAF